MIEVLRNIIVFLRVMSFRIKSLSEIFKWYEEHSKYIKLAQTTKITVEYILDNMKKKLQALQYADQSAMQPGA